MTTDSGLARSGRALSVRGSAMRPEIALVYGLLLLLLVWGSVQYTAFRTMGNYTNILEQSIVLGLVAIGQMGVLISGGLDMSVSAIAKVTVLVGAILMNGDNGNIWWVSLLLCLMGAAFGAFNGATIVWLRAAPFIVTFASYFLFLGVAYSISTEPVGLTPPAMVDFYGKKWLSIPGPVVMMALVWVLAWAVLRNTAFGRYVYAVGGRKEVAALAGIRTKGVQIVAYVVSGVFAVLAGLFILCISGVGDPQAGTNLQFLSITAAAVGGVSLLGGKGSLVGVLGGVLLLTVVSDLLQISRVNTFYEQPIQGVIVIIAVALYRNRQQVT